MQEVYKTAIGSPYLISGNDKRSSTCDNNHTFCI